MTCRARVRVMCPDEVLCELTSVIGPLIAFSHRHTQNVYTYTPKKLYICTYTSLNVCVCVSQCVFPGHELFVIAAGHPSSNLPDTMMRDTQRITPHLCNRCFSTFSTLRTGQKTFDASRTISIFKTVFFIFYKRQPYYFEKMKNLLRHRLRNTDLYVRARWWLVGKRHANDVVMSWLCVVY